MRRIIAMAAIFVGLLSGQPCYADTVTINFADLPIPAPVTIPSYHTDGYSFTISGGGNVFWPATPSTQGPFHGQPAYFGVNALAVNPEGATTVVTITRDDGRLFNLTQISAATFGLSQVYLPLVVIQSNRPPVDALSITQSHAFQTANLTDFNGVSSITLSALDKSGVFPAYQFTNLVLTSEGFPEPSSILMLGIGAGAILMRSRRSLLPRSARTDAA